MSVFKVHFEIGGGHVHCALFAAASPSQTYAKCGNFVVCRGPEFRDLMAAFKGAEFVCQENSIAEACKP